MQRESKFLFHELQILISQTTDFHFANYRFSFRKLQILISQTTNFHFTKYRFSFRFANYSKPAIFGFIQFTVLLPGVCSLQSANVIHRMIYNTDKRRKLQRQCENHTQCDEIGSYIVKYNIYV